MNILLQRTCSPTERGAAYPVANNRQAVSPRWGAQVVPRLSKCAACWQAGQTVDRYRSRLCSQHRFLLQTLPKEASAAHGLPVRQISKWTGRRACAGQNGLGFQQHANLLNFQISQSNVQLFSYAVVHREVLAANLIVNHAQLKRIAAHPLQSSLRWLLQLQLRRALRTPTCSRTRYFSRRGPKTLPQSTQGYPLHVEYKPGVDLNQIRMTIFF